MRGLKFDEYLQNVVVSEVAPHVGAWIEILLLFIRFLNRIVAPHVGAWIEIESFSLISGNWLVAPHVGAWIEILFKLIVNGAINRRTSRRCVD